MAGFRPTIAAAAALILAGLTPPAGPAGAAPSQTALTARSAELNRLVRERPELFEAIGAFLAEAEARQDATAAYRRRWLALGCYWSAVCGPR